MVRKLSLPGPPTGGQTLWCWRFGSRVGKDELEKSNSIFLLPIG
jgi:hypothetical protein